MDNKNNQMRIKLIAAVFIVFIGGMFALSRIIAPPTILTAERRLPARLPPLTLGTVISAEFMDRFDSYAADAFPFRDRFRALSSALAFGVFRQTDKNGLYMDANGAGEFKRIDPDSVVQLSEKILTVSDALSGVNIYYAFIPDKSIFSDKKLPGFDPELAKQLLTETPGMEKLTFINLTDALNADSFYRTDLHWDQIKLGSVLNALGASMGFDADLTSYAMDYAGELKGVYSGQLALPIGTDSIYYLSNPSLSAAHLNDLRMDLGSGDLYDWKKLSGLDAYDFFLSGAEPLIMLDNKDTTSDRMLYLFRDSFSSSLAPLIADAYSKVVLIDLRYIDMRSLSQFVEFIPGSDALFLYSTQVLNNSDMLLVPRRPASATPN